MAGGDEAVLAYVAYVAYSPPLSVPRSILPSSHKISHKILKKLKESWNFYKISKQIKKNISRNREISVKYPKKQKKS